MSNSVGCQTVVTSVTYYCSAVTDLSVSRSVHATELEPCCPDPFLLSSSECRAVHYGICSSLHKLPTFLTVENDTTDLNRNMGTEKLESHKQQPPGRMSTKIYSDSNPSAEGERSSLALLAENIESSVKPLLSTLLKTDNSDRLIAETGGESIGELAASLQYHLGNFLSAFHQQQNYKDDDVDVKDLNNAFAELKSLSSLFPNSSPIETETERRTLRTKHGLPIRHDDILQANCRIPLETDELRLPSPSENGLKGNDLDLLRKCKKISCSRAERAKNYFKHAELQPSEERNSTRMNISPLLSTPIRDAEVEVSSKPSRKNPGRETSELDDSDILDSLISLMNVSLRGLTNKQSDHCKGVVKHESKFGDTFSENTHLTSIRDSSNDGVREDTSEKSREAKLLIYKTPTSSSFSRKLTSPGSFDCGIGENPGVSSETEKMIGASKITRNFESNANGPREFLRINSRDLGTSDSKSELRSSSSLLRHDDGLPSIPLSDMKRVVHWRDRHSGSTDHQNFLTSTIASSVTERVMAFEKCPTWNVERMNGLWSSNHQHPIKMGKEPELPRRNHPPSQLGSYRSSLIMSYWDSITIPKFHFLHGPPTSAEILEVQLDKLKSVFQAAGGSFIKENFHVVAKVCSLPLYWKLPLYLSVGSDERGCVTMDRFFTYWKRMTSKYHDDASRFVYIFSRSKRPFLVHEDFRPMIQDIIDTHPGLSFLRNSKEFHSRYIDTVIARIYYNVNRSWSGNITALELRKSTFLQVVASLEEKDDINQMMDYFSYEHFYVIYCKFWKIDLDHDLLISKLDLRRHNNGDISTRMIERLFSGAVSRGEAQKISLMRYTDFVWFLLSEEDKRHQRSIEYWFRCMDLDGDGFLSMYELEYFYEEQVQRMEYLGIEALPFKDCLCQMLDMVRPKIPGKISLSDLKNCKMTTLFFDTFFNLGKYLEHEQRDPFANAKESDYHNPELTDWCKYAEEEYNILVSEENVPGYHDNSHANKMTKTESSDLGRAIFSHQDFNSSALNKCFVDDDDDDDYADSDADY